jgi:hypothetical protein
VRRSATQEEIVSGCKEKAATWPEGAALDGAMEAAFHDAVRRDRAANVPMVMWQGCEVRHVSPFDIPIPGDDPRAVDPRSTRAERAVPGRSG